MDSRSTLKNVQQRLEAGSDSIAVEIDHVFRDRLCRLVDREMDQIFKRRQDPEDVVQSVMKSFYKRTATGEFYFEDRNSIWALLKQVARNKLRTRISRDTAQRRDVFRELHADDEMLAVQGKMSDAQAHVLGEALEIALSRTRSPIPEFFQLQLYGHTVSEIVDIVLAGLPAPYPKILQLRLQGHSESEIASKIECGREAVRYKLKRIQERLKQLLSRLE